MTSNLDTAGLVERAAKLAQSRVVGGYMHGAAEWPDGDDIATAIRKLMESSDGNA